jgi:hypothetical protein
MVTKTLNEEDLMNFTGTTQWYRHPLVRSVLYTDGVQHVAETGGAYWLLDEIALAQSISKIKAEEFQVWKLTVQDRQGMLTCDDGNGRVVYAKRIDYTDFPLAEIKLYFTDNVIMLPSEY